MIFSAAKSGWRNCLFHLFFLTRILAYTHKRSSTSSCREAWRFALSRVFTWRVAPIAIKFHNIIEKRESESSRWEPVERDVRCVINSPTATSSFSMLLFPKRQTKRHLKFIHIFQNGLLTLHHRFSQHKRHSWCLRGSKSPLDLESFVEYRCAVIKAVIVFITFHAKYFRARFKEKPKIVLISHFSC